MIGDREDVSDILQDIFIDFFKKINDGSLIKYPKSWLYRATVNKCLDNLRNRKKFEKIDTLSDLEIAHESLENKDVALAITKAVSKLKYQERILITFYSEGLSYKEISEVTGIKFTSIGKMLSRTLKKLEKELRNSRYELS